LIFEPTKRFLRRLATLKRMKKASDCTSYISEEARKRDDDHPDALPSFQESSAPVAGAARYDSVLKPRAAIASAPLGKSIVELLGLDRTWWCEEGMRCSGLTCNAAQAPKRA
jgi:hypothetical protein